MLFRPRKHTKTKKSSLLNRSNIWELKSKFNFVSFSNCWVKTNIRYLVYSYSHTRTHAHTEPYSPTCFHRSDWPVRTKICSAILITINPFLDIWTICCHHHPSFYLSNWTLHYFLPSFQVSLKWKVSLNHLFYLNPFFRIFQQTLSKAICAIWLKIELLLHPSVDCLPNLTTNRDRLILCPPSTTNFLSSQFIQPLPVCMVLTQMEATNKSIVTWSNLTNDPSEFESVFLIYFSSISSLFSPRHPLSLSFSLCLL